VFWYPWGPEALERARVENKPILLSIGYSTCYWCHVMEREVFENLSIASLMNRHFINIKVDREEHPALDEIYMVARQLLTGEGGWPNNVFLTPELKPFYAGGTYAPDESYGKPAFPRLLEWLNASWTSQPDEIRRTADDILEKMSPYLHYPTPENPAKTNIPQRAADLLALLAQHHDERSGGFFQAPKFPHECYLQFLLGYHEATGDISALNMATRSLEKMAAGGIYDHVGCGFHRYAVDKEWYVPHFEKMLYNQAQLARAYTDASRMTSSAYLADIAKSVLDFVAGPMTDGNGGFYAGIDAETDGVEGAYYAWSAEEFKQVLSEEEVKFLTHFYALADIPEFPGHKHVNGQALIARKPLDEAARDYHMPYLSVAAMAGQLMNKLLLIRNQRKAPRLDDKIIVSWNGLMIDAFAHAGKVFGRPSYTARAREAADFILEHAIDNNGNLRRIYAAGRAQLDATLEDYAYLIKGLITLWRVTPDNALRDAAMALMARADDVFFDVQAPGYFFTQSATDMLVRIKSGDDGAMPNANAVMLHNLIDLADIAEEPAYLDKARALVAFFMDGNARILAEFSTMVHAALRLDMIDNGRRTQPLPKVFAGHDVSDDIAAITSDLMALGDDRFELTVNLELKHGWHINAHEVTRPYLIATQFDVQGEGVEVTKIDYPKPLRRPNAEGGEALPVYAGLTVITAQITIKDHDKGARPRILLRFQPCNGSTCYAVRDVGLTA
jgi:uncharacterized protein YyaL (SSP411 family)